MGRGHVLWDNKRTTWSVPMTNNEAKTIMSEFVKIANRENKDYGEIIVNFCKGYIKLHADGNPQSQITTFAKEGVAAYPTLGRNNADIDKFLEKLPEKDLKFMHKKAGYIQKSCVRIGEMHRVERRS